MGNCVNAVKDENLDEVDKKALEAESRKKEDKRDDEIGAYLLKVPLLAKLNDDDRATLGGALTEKKYSEGQKIVSEGEDGREFYIIKQGIAVVSKIEDLETKVENVLCELKKGDYFGEMALLNNAKRAATITAKGDVICLAMDQDKFQKLFGSKMKTSVTFAKRAAISAESFDPQEEKKRKGKIPPDAKVDKSLETRDMILGAISQNMLFKNLDRDQQTEIVNQMWYKEVKKGTSIIKQGDLGDNFYVVDKGNFDIFVSTDGKKPIKVANRGAGMSFGELALMYARPRAATVTSTEPASVWVLDRWTFRSILSQVNEKKLQEYEEFLKRVKSFEALLDYERSKIAEALEIVSYPDGHEIIKQGDVGDTFFIVKKGEVVVYVNENGERKEVMRYKPGDFFGERALVTNQVRAATCVTVGPVDCLYLDREAFTNLLGPLAEIFKERVKSYEEITSSSVSTSEKEEKEGSEADSPTHTEHKQRKNWTLADFTVVGTLGKGSFGHVQLVKDKSGETFALKSVSKAQIVSLGQQEHILSEKRVMAELDHPTLVRLHGTFKDKNCLYFVLELSLGGELFSVLRARTFFDEATARFFAASIVLAFEYMHSKGIIYRDLKPENLLLTDKGYLKITDFGFAKKIKDKRTWTLCGTPDYLAPEVVSGQGHDKSVDWWTLGILIYEMLASYPPFYDDDPMKTYAKIMHGQVAFPMHFSKQAVDLIKRLLHAKPTKRLGVLKGGAKLIKMHAWFKGFDWDAFEKQTMKAPIILPVKNREDLSNFEEYPEEDNGWEEYVPDPKLGDWDVDF